jgi:hypothetical protein
LKLAPLLAEYLFTNRQLDLPGIGSFMLDDSVQPDLELIKAGKETISEGIHFQANPALRESPELVNFIASSTGKIKALAAADLDSYLEAARQFLNIGKPYLFEGIGSLSKLQRGQYDFKPGAPVVEKANPRAFKETPEQEEGQTPNEGFRGIFYAPRVKTNYRKIVFVFLLLAGAGLAIWGGYKVYKNTTAGSKETAGSIEPVNQQVAEPSIPPDTANVQAANTQTPVDTAKTQTVPAPPPVPTGNFKFVVETADKVRGLTRFSKLKSFGLNIQMETRDSVSFKIYFLLPAVASDTSRILDSLKKLYTPAGSRAYVER